MPTTAVTGLRFKPHMDVKLISPIVPVSVKKPMQTTVVTGLLFLYPQMPLVLLIIPTARPNVQPGPVTRVINSPAVAVLLPLTARTAVMYLLFQKIISVILLLIRG